MAALHYDITLEQGADYQLALPVLDDTGAPVTVTGWTARVQVRRRASDSSVLAEFTTAADGGLTVAGTEVLLTVPAATSSAWVWTAGQYQLELVDPDGVVTRLAEGRFTVSPETTR